jgi:hypothetical protein
MSKLGPIIRIYDGGIIIQNITYQLFGTFNIYLHAVPKSYVSKKKRGQLTATRYFIS